MPKTFFEILEICSKLNKKSTFWWVVSIFLIVIIQIQNRHVRDHIEKEITTISLMDWKIIMFDYEGDKTTKMMSSLSIFFSQVKSKKLVTKKPWD